MTEKQRRSYQGWFAFSLFMCLVCVVVTLPNINEIRGAIFINPKFYRATSGTVIESKVGRHTGRSAGYYFNIEYIYKIDGQDYNSSQVTFGQRGDSQKAFAQSYVRKYPIGSRVRVYYKIDEPSFAVLEPTVADHTKIIFTGVLCAFMICLIVIMWTARKLL